MHRTVPSIIFSAAWLLASALPACSTVRVARPDNWSPAIPSATQPDVLSTPYSAAHNAFAVSAPATTLRRKTVWVCGWGYNQHNVDTPDALGNGLAEVRVKNNLLFSLINVATLGFVQPVTVQWKCAKQPQPDNKDF